MHQSTWFRLASSLLRIQLGNLSRIDGQCRIFPFPIRDLWGACGRETESTINRLVINQISAFKGCETGGTTIARTQGTSIGLSHWLLQTDHSMHFWSTFWTSNLSGTQFDISDAIKWESELTIIIGFHLIESWLWKTARHSLVRAGIVWCFKFP